MKKLIIAIILDLILLGAASYGLAQELNKPPVLKMTGFEMTIDRTMYQGESREAYLIIDEFGNIKEVSKEDYEAIR